MLPVQAASPQGAAVEIFPLGGVGGCFYFSLPCGKVQCPNYIKCKPYVGSLTEQTHLSNTYHKAEEVEEHLLMNTSVSITPPVVLQGSQLRCEHFCSEMKSTSWHSVNKKKSPTINIK